MIAIAVAFGCGAVKAEVPIRKQLEPYSFMLHKPPRHALGASMGVPQFLNAHYEYALSLDRFGRAESLLGLDLTIAPVGGGLSYRARLPETNLFMMIGYGYLSVPRGLVDAEVDLGWRVRHSFTAMMEVRWGDLEMGRQFLFGAGAYLEMNPLMEVVARPAVSLGVVHPLGGRE